GERGLEIDGEARRAERALPITERLKPGDRTVSDSLDRLESLFAAALPRSAAERQAYLDEACADGPALRQRGEALLRAQRAAGSFLESPLAGLAASALDLPGAEGPGTVIGPYRLVEQIGEGGMGLVFAAEQQQPVQRKVALKVLKPG